MLDVVSINAVIVGLRAGQFCSHLMRERPKTIQRLYEEFRMCMEEQSHQKKSAKANQSNEREWSHPRNATHANPRNVFGLEGENAHECSNPLCDTPNQNSSPPSHYIKIKRAAAETEGEAVVAEVVVGTKATKRKESGTAFFTKRMMTTVPTIVLIKKVRGNLRRREKGEREKQFCQSLRPSLAKTKLWVEPFRQPFSTTSLLTTYPKLHSTTTLAIPGFPSSKC
jgi:hypothetical protein